jgi:hypothetical protein
MAPPSPDDIEIVRALMRDQACERSAMAYNDVHARKVRRLVQILTAEEIAAGRQPFIGKWYNDDERPLPSKKPRHQ